MPWLLGQAPNPALLFGGGKQSCKKLQGLSRDVSRFVPAGFLVLQVGKMHAVGSALTRGAVRT